MIRQNFQYFLICQCTFVKDGIDQYFPSINCIIQYLYHALLHACGILALLFKNVRQIALIFIHT